MAVEFSSPAARCWTSPQEKTCMKSPAELLLVKELELQKVKREIEALRLAARLLDDQTDQPKPAPQKLSKLVQMP
jgi:hypothetical protein